MIDIPALIPHFERMIRHAENQRMAAFLKDLVAKLSDPSHVPTGKWGQAGEWGDSDLSLIPAWIRLDAYDESRVLEAMSYEQKLGFWKIKRESRRKQEWENRTRRGGSDKQVGGSKRARVLKALKSGEWVTIESLMKKSGSSTRAGLRGHVDHLRTRGWVIRRRWNSEGAFEYQLIGKDELADRRILETVTPHTQVLEALQTHEWVTTEALMAKCECGRHRIQESIYQLRKRGHSIHLRRNAISRTSEYQLEKVAPAKTLQSATSTPQVPAVREAEIHPVQGVEKEHDHGSKNESGNHNHNPGNGTGAFRCVQGGGSKESPEAL